MTVLVATVGSNPLPVVVPVRALEPNRLRLLYTGDVLQVTDRISNHLKKTLPNCEVSLLEIKDHQKAKSICATLGGIDEDWPNTNLNYTGGTKLMAVHVHSFWKEKGGRSENASYLGSDGRLYFDDATRNPMQERQLPKLSLAELCQLHFGKQPKKLGDQHLGEKRLNLATIIHRCVCNDGFDKYRGYLPPLYCERKLAKFNDYDFDDPIECDWQAAKESNFKTTGAFFKMDLSSLFHKLGVSATNIESFSRWLDGDSSDRKVKTKTNLDNAKWLYSLWLEVWLADQLSRMITTDGEKLFDEVHHNVVIGDEPDSFEMDVVAVRGYRLFLFSCTVDDNNYLVKSKLFEANNRTTRIGGEHACAAIVCLHNNPQSVLKTVQAEHWPGYDTLRLFGQAHIKGGQAPCQADQQAHLVTLQKGIEEWVLRT
ncbi:MAG TPA: hypothetical protein PK880_10645 [Candidatus Competibacter sp.]|nr:hypothetical protein [Candidatus Competibacter sp.]